MLHARIQEFVTAPGRLLYVDGSEVWRADGRNIYRSDDGGQNWKLRAVVEITGLRNCLIINKITRRLGRTGVHQFVKTGDDSAILIANREIYRLDPGKKTVTQVAILHGSRPLALCKSEDRLYYGEYRANPERSPVHIWSCDLKGEDWQQICRFTQVRHIHGIFRNPYSHEFWATSGDRDEESAIWRTSDKFESLEKVIGGNQKYRAVELLFSENGIYYGSDAPDTQNFIYYLDPDASTVQALQQVGGPVFYGQKVSDFMFFSTVCEPSKINKTDEVELWVSVDGISWNCLLTLRKDFWPMKYFQYGQLLFPNGPGDNKNLWFTPVSTVFDQQVIKLPLREIEQRL